MLSEMSASLASLVLVMRRIFDSKLPFLFWSDAECFSHRMELALACRSRVWGTLDGQIGFPELFQENKIVPPFLEDLRQRLPSSYSI